MRYPIILYWARKDSSSTVIILPLIKRLSDFVGPSTSICLHVTFTGFVRRRDAGGGGGGGGSCPVFCSIVSVTESEEWG